MALDTSEASVRPNDHDDLPPSLRVRKPLTGMPRSFIRSGRNWVPLGEPTQVPAILTIASTVRWGGRRSSV